MLRNILGLLGLVIALTVCPALPAHDGQPPGSRQAAQPTKAGQPEQPPKDQPKPPEPPPEPPPFSKFSKTPDIIDRLKTEIATKGFEKKMTLDEALDTIREALAAKKKGVSFLVDVEAFRAEAPPPKVSIGGIMGPDLTKLKPPPSVLMTKIELQPLPEKLSAATLLRLVLAEIPNYKATYLIRKGGVVITTAKAASIKGVLEEKVSGNFYQTPFYEVLYSLSDQTGATIVMDREHVLNPKAWYNPITATFGHSASLESALNLICESVGAKAAVVGDGILITTVENAERLRYMPK